jgi:DNA polymerase III delta prime subunit
MEHLLWTEKYRPVKVADCILPERLKTVFQEFVNQNEMPNLLLSGGAGVGKTSIAKAMCNEIGCDYMIINGSDENGVDTIRVKIKNYASSLSFSGGRKVVIIDEADYLTANAQAILRNAIEEFANNCSFIFTCNYKAKIIEPLHSRCAVIDFNLKPDEKTQMASAFFKRIEFVLDSEKTEYDKKVVAELIKKHFPDFRRVINELQRYAKLGKIDVGILSQIADVSIADIIKHLKAKDFTSMRKWAATSEVDHSTFYRKIYDGMYEILKPQCIPQIVVILADYQYKQAFVADQEINLVACLTEIMANGEFV